MDSRKRTACPVCRGYLEHCIWCSSGGLQNQIQDILQPVVERPYDSFASIFTDAYSFFYQHHY